MPAMLDGKQLKAGTIALAKLIGSELATLLRADGSVALTGSLNANSQRITSLGAPQAANDAARLQDVYNLPWKDKCLVATTANITLSGSGQTVDGIAVPDGSRVLVRAQTNSAENGIYIAGGGPWVRAADADSAGELRGALVTVEKGTVYADHRFALNADDVTVGTTALLWVDIGVGTPAAFPVANNKDMAASVTSADFQQACATPIAATPASDSHVLVYVNGLEVPVGDGVKTKCCYFSGDSGATARTIANIALGDTLWWVGSVAGYQLAATDSIDFVYVV